MERVKNPTESLAAYNAPTTKTIEVNSDRCILNSYGANINNLNNQTYDWSDSDWSDVE